MLFFLWALSLLQASHCILLVYYLMVLKNTSGIKTQKQSNSVLCHLPVVATPQQGKLNFVQSQSLRAVAYHAKVNQHSICSVIYSSSKEVVYS